MEFFWWFVVGVQNNNNNNNTSSDVSTSKLLSPSYCLQVIVAKCQSPNVSSQMSVSKCLTQTASSQDIFLKSLFLNASSQNTVFKCLSPNVRISSYCPMSLSFWGQAFGDSELGTNIWWQWQDFFVCRCHSQKIIKNIAKGGPLYKNRDTHFY